MDPSQDPTIRQLREKVSDVDRGLVEAINARLRLVAQLKNYKDSRGYAFVDPEREEWMFRDVSRANRGICPSTRTPPWCPAIRSRLPTPCGSPTPAPRRTS